MPATLPGKGTVVIVDDDASARMGLSRYVRCAGYAVESFASAEEFSMACRCEGPACLVADVRMQGGGGLRLAEQLCQAGTPIPVILVSADNREEVRRRAKALGAAGFFHKPVDGRALLDAIEWALTQRAPCGPPTEGRAGQATPEAFKQYEQDENHL
jgi:FixJ family two-component response regulator